MGALGEIAVDDIDGWPEVSGTRLASGDDSEWRVTLTPDGIVLDGGERTARVGLPLVYAVRQRSESDHAVFELEWITALEEERSLKLRCDDPQAAQRLADVLAAQLKAHDGEQSGRGVDWWLVFLVVLGAVPAVRDAGESHVWAGGATLYDWTALWSQFFIEIGVTVLLGLALRWLVRWFRRRIQSGWAYR